MNSFPDLTSSNSQSLSGSFVDVGPELSKDDIKPSAEATAAVPPLSSSSSPRQSSPSAVTVFSSPTLPSSTPDSFSSAFTPEAHTEPSLPAPASSSLLGPSALSSSGFHFDPLELLEDKHHTGASSLSTAHEVDSEPDLLRSTVTISAPSSPQSLGSASLTDLHKSLGGSQAHSHGGADAAQCPAASTSPLPHSLASTLSSPLSLAVATGVGFLLGLVAARLLWRPRRPQGTLSLSTLQALVTEKDAEIARLARLFEQYLKEPAPLAFRSRWLNLL